MRRTASSVAREAARVTPFPVGDIAVGWTRAYSPGALPMMPDDVQRVRRLPQCLLAAGRHLVAPLPPYGD